MAQKGVQYLGNVSKKNCDQYFLNVSQSGHTGYTTPNKLNNTDIIMCSDFFQTTTYVQCQI